MSYLLTQMSLYMLATFLLGLLLGWLFWRYGKPTSGDHDRLSTERAALIKERDDLQTNLDACRTRSAEERRTVEALRGDKIDLQNRLDGMANDRVREDELEVLGASIPAAAASVIPEAVTPSVPRVASKPEGLTAPRSGGADDLKQISGIGPAMEKLLHGLGYYHFDQVAAWTPAEEAWVDDNLEGFKGRVSRDNWIDQAKVLSRP